MRSSITVLIRQSGFLNQTNTLQREQQTQEPHFDGQPLSSVPERHNPSPSLIKYSYTVSVRELFSQCNRDKHNKQGQSLQDVKFCPENMICFHQSGIYMTESKPAHKAVLLFTKNSSPFFPSLFNKVKMTQ